MAHLAADAKVMARSGKVLVVVELAQDHDFTDVDGKRPRSMADDPSALEV